MTQTSTITQPQPEAATDPDRLAQPPNFLLTLIVTLLAPMFLGVTAGDVAMARLAALATVNDYRARNNADLIAVGQIIAYGLAALGSLCLSMADDLSLSMTLKLRGNANALNRSAEQIRRAVKEGLYPAPVTHKPPAEPASPHAAPYESPDAAPHDGDLDVNEVILSVEAVKVLAAEAEARLKGGEQVAVPTSRPGPAAPSAQAPVQTPAPPAVRAPMSAIEAEPATVFGSALAATTPVSDKRLRQMWAIAMVKEAGEITANLPNLPPAERKAATIQAAALSSAASELLTGVAPPPPIFLAATPAMRPHTD